MGFGSAQGAPDDAGAGYVLSWGANSPSAAGFAAANGDTNASPLAALDQDSEITVPVAGTVTAFSWNTASADATSVFKLHLNAVVSATIAATGATGSDTSLSFPVAAGDQLAVEFDAGTQPGKGNYTVFIR